MWPEQGRVSVRGVRCVGASSACEHSSSGETGRDVREVWGHVLRLLAELRVAAELGALLIEQRVDVLVRLLVVVVVLLLLVLLLLVLLLAVPVDAVQVLDLRQHLKDCLAVGVLLRDGAALHVELAQAGERRLRRAGSGAERHQHPRGIAPRQRRAAAARAATCLQKAARKRPAPPPASGARGRPPVGRAIRGAAPRPPDAAVATARPRRSDSAPRADAARGRAAEGRGWGTRQRFEALERRKLVSRQDEHLEMHERRVLQVVEPVRERVVCQLEPLQVG